MALSDSTNYNRTGGDVISAALRLVGIGLNGETATAQEISDTQEALNDLLKLYSRTGLKLHLMREHAVTLIASEDDYLLGRFAQSTTTSTTADKLVDSGGTFDVDGTVVGDIVYNVTDGTEAAITAIDSATTLSLDSDIMVSGDVYEIGRSNSSFISKPDFVKSAYLRDSNNTDSVQLTGMGRDEYLMLSDKLTTGTPNQFYYDPQLDQGKLYLWPVPDATAAAEYTLYINYRKPADDIDATTDDIEMPQESYLFLKWTLADEIMMEYDIPESKQSRIEKKASKYRKLYEGLDIEKDRSVHVFPNKRRR